MRKKHFINALAIVFISCTSIAPSESAPCDTSVLKLPSKVLAGVTFGMTVSAARMALEKEYGAKASVTSADESVAVIFKDNHQELFNLILLGIHQGVVTRVTISYSKSFQDKFGGTFDTLVVVLGKLTETIGVKASKINEKSKTEIEIDWEENGGATLTLVGNSMMLEGSVYARYSCVSLEKDLKNRQAATTNFGL